MELPLARIAGDLTIMPEPEVASNISDEPSGDSSAADSPRRIWDLVTGTWAVVGRMRWPIFSLFQLGMIIGLSVVWPRTTVSTATFLVAADREPERATRAAKPVEPREAFPTTILLQGDQLIREGRIELALVTYRSLLGGDRSALPALLRYRIAVCLECLGKFDQAIAEFSAVRSAAADPLFEIAAELGQTRIWMRTGQSAEAKNLLCDLLLRSGMPEFRGRTFLAETVHRLARLMAQEYSGIEPTGPWNPNGVAHAGNESPRESALDWITTDMSHDDSAASGEPTAIQIENSQGTAEQMMVHGLLARCSVAQALQQLTAACGRQCLLTPEAQQLIADRTTSVLVDSLPLATVLTAITEPLGIIWELTDNAVHFCCDHEVSREALAAYRARYAERALTDALERHPRQSLVAFAQFELGNIEYTRGKFQDAAVIYQSLSASAPRCPVALEASYNLGLALCRMGQIDAAREAFYRVVDGAPGHALAALACLSIGRMYLDQGEFDRAISPLRRATAIASASDTRATAALLLASAYLLMGNADAANSILAQHRERLTDPPYRNVTAFMGSYARMLSSGNRRQAQREARVLMWAVVGASRESVLGPTGVLLMGHAYRELGLGDKMIELYQKALQEGVPPAIAPEMWFDMAEHSFATGELDAASHRFTELAAAGSGKWNRLARVRLAEIALDDGRPEDCREWCRNLLEPPLSTDAPTVLKLMGRAYEQEGLQQEAALCFAGRVPEYEAK